MVWLTPVAASARVRLDGDTEITAPGRSSAPGAAKSAKTAEAGPEELLQYLIEAAEIAEQISGPELLATVVCGTPIRVGEDLVRLGDLPETCFRLRIVRIGIGVGLSGELAKCLS